MRPSGANTAWSTGDPVLDGVDVAGGLEPGLDPGDGYGARREQEGERHGDARRVLEPADDAVPGEGRAEQEEPGDEHEPATGVQDRAHQEHSGEGERRPAWQPRGREQHEEPHDAVDGEDVAGPEQQVVGDTDREENHEATCQDHPGPRRACCRGLQDQREADAEEEREDREEPVVHEQVQQIGPAGDRADDTDRAVGDRGAGDRDDVGQCDTAQREAADDVEGDDAGPRGL
jgi:hypothetical protein